MITHPKHSLRNKVGKIIAIFSIVIIIFYTGVMAFLLEWGLANGSGAIIWQEARLFIQDYEKDPNTPLPDSRSVKGYIGFQNLPQEVADVFEVRYEKMDKMSKKQRWYRLIQTKDAFLHHNMLVSALPGTEEKLFVHYKLIIPKNLDFDVWDSMYYTAIAGGILVTFMLLVFRKVLQRSLNPLISLSAWIDRIEENQAPEKLPDDIPDNEIGQVAYSLFQALERINISNEREKQFLRNASHELRTPIAIIRNTMDVLEHKRKSGDENLDHLLERIRRAGDTMKSVTEAILWLAIENYSPPTAGTTNLYKIALQIVEDNQKLLEGRTVDLEFSPQQTDDIMIEKSLIYIVLDNLIRNAFQHTAHGKVLISTPNDTSFEIINTRQDVEETQAEQQKNMLATGGFGLGLALVQKIADKMGWTFTFVTQEHHVVAKLDISKTA